MTNTKHTFEQTIKKCRNCEKSYFDTMDSFDSKDTKLYCTKYERHLETNTDACDSFIRD